MVLVLTLLPARASAQDDSWRADVEKMLNEFLLCQTPIDDQSPCNVFLARALKRVYGIIDFEDPKKPNNALTANEIAAYVAASPNWTKLGTGAEQAALTDAQGYANLKRAVIAVYSGAPHGHVALIVPGTATASASWGLTVPRSASFLLGNPGASYVGKSLSHAFGSDKKGGVILFGRNTP